METRWIRRLGTATRGFRYVAADGRAVGAAQRARIEALRIPPAWREVHVAPGANAAVQAWGLDARGRRQYRYHRRAVERGAQRKFHRVRRLGHDLPRLRTLVAHDIARRDGSREQVAALAVRLLAEGFFRVGSERYVRENKTFGLVTMRKSHVTVEGDVIQCRYVGKGALPQRQVVVDRLAAREVRRLLATPGPRLFRYRTGDGWCDLTARDVNEYVRARTGLRYSAKDFRTWGGTLRLATVLAELGPSESRTARTRDATLAVRLVAAELGNTPAICRASYVHPIVLARFVDAGETIRLPPFAPPRRGAVRHPEERALMRLLDRCFPERRWAVRPEERMAG
jgi:DNA topoisomerase-1